MIKLVFFDIDGTLIPFNTGILPVSTYKGLLKLRENGIKIYVATGKSLAQMSSTQAFRIPFDGYLTLNGQLCYDKNLHMFFGTPIDDKEMEVLEQIFNANRIPFSLVGEFSRYINFVDEKAASGYIKTNSPIPDIGKYMGEKIYQITAFVNERQREVFEDVLDYCTITSWAPGAIDIMPKQGGKMNAIKRIMEINNCTPEECMAFGDAENDIKMLELVGTGVAMGNGTQRCKAAADYITDNVDDNGIYKALVHFGLI